MKTVSDEQVRIRTLKAVQVVVRAQPSSEPMATDVAMYIEADKEIEVRVDLASELVSVGSARYI